MHNEGVPKLDWELRLHTTEIDAGVGTADVAQHERVAVLPQATVFANLRKIYTWDLYM